MNQIYNIFFLFLLVYLPHNVALNENIELIKDNVVSNQIKDFLSKMTLEEKIGQMTQLTITSILTDDKTQLNYTRLMDAAKKGVGSYLNSPFSDGPIFNKTGWNSQEWKKIISEIQRITLKYGKIPILYGIDSVHGAIYTEGVVYFPQQINAGASFNPSLVYEMGKITARDTLASGIQWIFAPILDIAFNPLWPRMYETFGEDPFVVSRLGVSLINGIQSNKKVAACFKHFIGYSKTSTGHDRSNVELSDFDLLNYYAVPFISAIKEANVLTGMEAYSSFNGIPTVVNTKLLNTLLREDIKFNGTLVTDWNEIYNLQSFHRFAKTNEEAIFNALNRTSLDISMVPYDISFITHTNEFIQQNKVTQDRIDSSVLRILKLKEDLGLFANDSILNESISNKEEIEKDIFYAKTLAEESIILLKNDDAILPLSIDIINKSKILLTGPSINSIANLCGGWTVAWQGATSDKSFTYGSSIQTSIEKILMNKCNVNNLLCENGIGMDTYNDSERKKAIELASNTEYTIIALGEKPYAEKPGDIETLYLSDVQIDYVNDLSKTGTKIIIILIEGRPRLLKNIPSLANAILLAFLPCELGGDAITSILFGKSNPSGKLPISYPKHHGEISIPYYKKQNTLCGNRKCEQEWEFGAGLSYSEFYYSNMQIHSDNITNERNQFIHVTIDLENKSSREGKETVLLFLSQAFRQISIPEVKMLKKFEKISFLPNEKKTISFTLSYDDWSYYLPEIGNGLKKYVEAGEFYISIKYKTSCEMYHPDSILHPLCKRFIIHPIN